jgi:hypothetical protein
MSQTRIELVLHPDLASDLARIAEACGMRDIVEAATVGLAEWASWRTARLDDHDPAARYFVNEALDELMERRK